MVRSNYQPWLLQPGDFPAAATLAKRLEFLCGYGLLAPSVHNTQPWQFAVRGSRLVIGLAPQRRLAAGDPTGREAWLSLGACVENIMLAGAHFGLRGIVEPLNPASDSVTISWQETNGRPQPELLAAIAQRTSNRASYEPRAIVQDYLEQIKRSYAHRDLKVVVSAARPLIEEVADLTSHGIGLALSNPDFKRELAALLRPSWTRRFDGFAPQPGPIRSAIEAQRTRWLPIARRQAAHELHVMQHSAALIVVFSRGDTKPYWLEAGRAYQRCALEATRLGLATSTTAAIVEAADYHLDIEARCQTNFRLQTVMRLGYGPAQPHSPRRSFDQVSGPAAT